MYAERRWTVFLSFWKVMLPQELFSLMCDWQFGAQEWWDFAPCVSHPGAPCGLAESEAVKWLIREWAVGVMTHFRRDMDSSLSSANHQVDAVHLHLRESRYGLGLTQCHGARGSGSTELTTWGSRADVTGRIWKSCYHRFPLSTSVYTLLLEGVKHTQKQNV